MSFGLQVIAIMITSVMLLVFGMIIRGIIGLCRSDNMRASIYIFLGIFIFLIFPLTLNAIITNKWHYKIPIESAMGFNEWFGFWGSYIGSMVAILLGWVAHRQTELSNQQEQQAQKQQEQITKLDEIVNMYRLKPRIAIRSFQMEVFNEPLKEYQVQWYMEEMYFTYFGQKRPVDGKRYIVLTADIINEGMIPVTKYDIEWVEWEIAGKKFKIVLKDSHNIQIADKIVIIIDEHVRCSESIDDLFNELTMHVKYNNYKKVNYDKSILTLFLQFYNSVTESDPDDAGSGRCEIKCMINSARIREESNQIEAVSYIDWKE